MRNLCFWKKVSNIYIWFTNILCKMFFILRLLYIYIYIQYGTPVLCRVKRSFWYHWAVKAQLPELIVAVYLTRHAYSISNIRSGRARSLHSLSVFCLIYVLLHQIWYMDIIYILVCFCILSALGANIFKNESLKLILCISVCVW